MTLRSALEAISVALAPPLLALLAGGCQGPGALAGDLGELVAAGRFAVGARGEAPLAFPEAPEPSRVTVGGEQRPAVLTAAGRWAWRGRLPDGARLVGGIQLLEEAWPEAPLLTVEVSVREGGVRSVAQVLRVPRRTAGAWVDFEVDLAPWGGESVELELTARLPGSDPVVANRPVVVWAPLRVVAPGPVDRAPNVVFILVDTLRADRLTPYGYRRGTSPAIQRLLADRGAVFERAYSQCSWTVPSMVSMMTSRWPQEVLGSDPAGYAIGASLRPLAELFAERGYQTAAFVANPVLRMDNGFARGFDTFYTPESPRAVTELHAEDVTGRARSWLEGVGDRPFFLWVHYIDPHDPYQNPDLVDGRSPFFPTYRGERTGRDVHGLYLGKLPLRLPDDVHHLSALYDSEVAYVDRHVGRLLAAIPPEVAAHTLFVLTADHGEELYDHRGWKHGRTVYEEQIHVPWIVRWDGVVGAGRRVRRPVRLLDLAPTLAAAAEIDLPEQWEGRSLWPTLTGGDEPPRRPVYAQHLSSGPVRAAVVRDGWKLILFDRQARTEPQDAHQAILAAEEAERLQRIELYDLEADPGEQHEIAAEHPDLVRGLGDAVYRQLESHLPGLRILLAGSAAGSRVDGRIRFERAPRGWSSLFLGPGDEARLEGDTLVLSLRGEPLSKGVRVVGDFGGILEATVTASRQPVPPLRVGDGQTYGGGVLAASALRAERWPASGEGLYLWLPGEAVAGHGEASEESRRRLEALGYL